MPERIDFWGIPLDWGPPELYVYTLMGLSALVMLFRFYRHARLWWRIGRPEIRWDRPFIRVGRLITYAIVQTRVLRQRFPGIMHIGLAWGFFVFFLGTALATVHSHFFEFLWGNVYLIYKLVLDTFTVFFLIGAAMAAYRRFAQRPSRLTFRPGFTWALVAVTVIVLSGLVVESLRIAHDRPEWAVWSSPAGWVLAQVWIATGASQTTLLNWHLGVWIFHLLMVALVLVTLPVSTLVHLVTGPLNVFFSKIDQPMGQLAPIEETEQGTQVYVSRLRDMTWKQLLDSDACTECGRCQDACPAFAAGTPLNPKELMLGLRTALWQDGPDLLNKDVVSPPLFGVIREPMLWSCTTCGACVCECPVLIEHIDLVVDMRRYLVIEGRVDEMLQDALANLGRYGNSFGQSGRARAKWTRPVEPQIKDARKEEVEYLWFVGDYASYSASLTDITLKTAEVFQRAGLDFGIVYDGENNAGNDVRRVGEEGLFEMLVEKNVASMSQCTFERIVTTDPHSYNALKNEYPTNGSQPVLHHAELLDKLIASDQLTFSKQLGYKVTFHDPCYLGRYNGIYDAPRRVIEATGCKLIEMPRCRDRALCCGAGGGRIWMDEGEVKERPSEMRIREAVELDGVEIFVVACPKDVTMYQDAIKTTGHEAHLVVKDLIELVHEAL